MPGVVWGEFGGMARLAAGRWSKWLVVVVWVMVFGVAGRWPAS
jgi:hypothetical protein